MATTQFPPPSAVRATGRPLSAATTAPEVHRPPYLMAACVAAGALLLYLLTLAPTTQFWDTSEYIAAAYSLGIPHPPGNPLFVLMAHVWGLIPLVSGYAERVNLFAALTSAVSAGCWFLVGERWLRSFVPARWPRRLAALAGAIVSATAFTVWNQSVVNEKVYTLSLLSIALILWLIVRWDDQPAGDAHDHHLLLIIYLLALTATNHMMGVLVGPVVMVLLLPTLKQQRPVTAGERSVEWSQFIVFTSVWALLLSLGLEHWEFIAIAGVLCADELAGAVGCPQPPAVRQALHLRRSHAGTGRHESRSHPDPLLGSAGQLRTVLQLAVWPRLPGPRAAAAGGVVRLRRIGWRGAPLARRQAHRDRHDGPDVHLHVRARLLPELQVRLLAASGRGRESARGAAARLLLHLLVRHLGHLGGHGPRGRDRMGGRPVPRAPAGHGTPLAVRHAAAGAGADPAGGQPAHGVAKGRDAGARLRLRPAAIGRAVRRPRHRRRQRHLPAVVRAGGRRHSPRRHDRQPLAGEYRLVRAPAAAAAARALRFDPRARGVSR